MAGRLSAHWPTAVDLFCGCGGVTEGLKRRHFRVVAAVDNNPVACRTFRLNHRAVRLYERDVRDVDPWAISEKLLDGRDLDLLVVCAPCQPFSSQSKSSSGEDGRTALILEALRFVRVLQPRVILFENVAGIARGVFSTLVKDLRRGLLTAGYSTGEPFEINAADYGVPQRRWRWLMLAGRSGDPPGRPEPTTPAGQRVTVSQAIGALPPLQSGETYAGDPLHFARNHEEITLERLSHIPKNGGSRSALPANLVLECHKGYRGHPDVYGRMKWDDVAPTLTTGCTDVTRGRFAHPEQNRAITLREAARLQTFPDDYQFAGSAGDIATQIGNAVPVRLIYEIAPALRSALRS